MMKSNLLLYDNKLGREKHLKQSPNRGNMTLCPLLERHDLTQMEEKAESLRMRVRERDQPINK